MSVPHPEKNIESHLNKKLPADLHALCIESIDKIIKTFMEKGYLGDYGTLRGGWHETFGIKDWWRLFRTVPEMRRYFIPSLFWNMLCGYKPGPKHGLAETLDPNGRYFFTCRSFCSDLLILETAVDAAVHIGYQLPPNLPEKLNEYSRLSEDNGFILQNRNVPLLMFGYYLKTDNLVDKNTEIYKIFFSTGLNEYDNDSHCIQIASYLRLKQLGFLSQPLKSIETEQLNETLNILSEHVWGRGKYGMGGLSYDTGLKQGDSGILTWIYDKHNEMDPVSNINILNFLVIVLQEKNINLRLVHDLFSGILDYLDQHRQIGDLFHYRLHLYYPLASFYSLWFRFLGNFKRLDKVCQYEFDPEGRILKLNKALQQHCEALRKQDRIRKTDLEFIAAFPYFENLEQIQNTVIFCYNQKSITKPIEFCHLPYPSKSLMAPIFVAEGIFLQSLLCLSN